MLQTVISRSKIFEGIINKIPGNEYGLPKFFLRSDLIPSDIEQLEDTERQDILSSARLEISYSEGYPTLDETQLPIWYPMPNEQNDDYSLFKGYMDLGNSGVRALSDLQVPLYNNPNLSNLKELFTYYFWYHRAQAFDLFQIARSRRMRDQRILKSEDSQYLKAEMLLLKLDTHLECIFSQEKMEQLAPEEAVRIYDKLYQIQRRALGLDNKNNNTNKSQEGAIQQNAPMEVIFRQVARQIAPEQTNKGVSHLDMLRTNPQAAELAQELIIKLGQQKASNDPNEQIFSRPKQPMQIDQTNQTNQLPISNPEGPTAKRAESGHQASGHNDKNKIDEVDEGYVEIDEFDTDMIGL